GSHAHTRLSLHDALPTWLSHAAQKCSALFVGASRRESSDSRVDVLSGDIPSRPGRKRTYRQNGEGVVFHRLGFRREPGPREGVRSEAHRSELKSRENTRG